MDNIELKPENKSNETIMIENLLASNKFSMDEVVQWFSEKLKLILLESDNNILEVNSTEYNLVLQKSYREISLLFTMFYRDIKSILNLGTKLTKDQLYQIESILNFFQKKINEKTRKIKKSWELPNNILESFNNMKYLLADLVLKNNEK